MSDTAASAQGQAMQAIVAEHRTWFTVLGIVLVVLGIVAIAFPFLTTIAAKIFLGWLFLIGGAVQVVHAFSTQRWSEFLLNLLIGALYVVVGAWLAFFPLTGIITLTIVLAALFIIEGALEIGMGFRIRPKQGWGWLLFSGIIAVAAGVLVFAGLPSTATWAIGLLVGVNLLASGLSFMLLAAAARA
jgi:uncharacterized membrane protein HdeD (DUF308 family)